MLSRPNLDSGLVWSLQEMCPWLRVATSLSVCLKSSPASWHILLTVLTVPVYDSPVRSPVAVTISASGFQLPWTLSPPRRWPWMSSLVVTAWLLFAMRGPRGLVNISSVPCTTPPVPCQPLPSLLSLQTRFPGIAARLLNDFVAVWSYLRHKCGSFRFGHLGVQMTAVAF